MGIITYTLITAACIYAVSVLYLLTGLYRLSYRKNDKRHFYSVIITVHNEEENLEKCLECLVNQDYSTSNFEVILANDRSTDSTPSIIGRYCQKFKNFKSVEVGINETAIPKKTALIRALEIARGDIILSTDGDCMQSPGWISSINNCFSPNVIMVIGHVGYFRPENVWQGIDALDYLTHRALGAAFLGVKSVYTCTAANMAYRREIFDEHKDEFKGLKIRPAEDNFILHCARNSGKEIAVSTDPLSIIETQGARSFAHFLNQRFRWAAYGANITTRGVKLFFIPTLLFYLMIWVSLITAIFSPAMFRVIGVVMLSKMIIDFILIARYTQLYKIQHMLKYFVPLSIIHPVLALLAAIKGNLFPFTWKNKRYTKENEVSE